MFVGGQILSPDSATAFHLTGDGLLAALAPRQKPARTNSTITKTHVLAAHSHFDTEPMVTCQKTGAICAFWGQIFDMPDGLALPADSPAPLIALTAWQTWGEEFVNFLSGDFSLAIIDPQTQTTVLARDVFGSKPLFYAANGTRITFATSIPALRHGAQVPTTIRREWIAQYLVDPALSMSATKTPFHAIASLPAGHILVAGPDQPPQITPWRRFRDDPPQSAACDPRWVQTYQQQFQKAVQRRTSDLTQIAAESSGGIDSASIIGVLADQMGDAAAQGVICFGQAHNPFERDMIQSVSTFSNLPQTHIRTRLEPDNLDHLAQEVAILGYPGQHVIGQGFKAFETLVSPMGLRVVLSGFGGDEVGTHPATDTRTELYDQRMFGALWSRMGGRTWTKPIRFLRILIQGNDRTANQRSLSGWANTVLADPLITQQVVSDYHLTDQVSIIAAKSGPFRRVNDRIMHYELENPNVAVRMECHSVLANAFGAEYRWPLWDMDLVQTYLSTPSIEKLGPKSMGRYLHRRALSEFGPEKVIWKRSKQMGQVNSADVDAPQIANQLTAQIETLIDGLHPVLQDMVERSALTRLSNAIQDAKQDLERQLILADHLTRLMAVNIWLHAENADVE